MNPQISTKKYENSSALHLKDTLHCGATKTSAVLTAAELQRTFRFAPSAMQFLQQDVKK